MKEKGIVYKRKDIVDAVSFLNSVKVVGIDNARCISAIANILDNGMETEININKEGIDENGIDVEDS